MNAKAKGKAEKKNEKEKTVPKWTKVQTATGWKRSHQEPKKKKK